MCYKSLLPLLLEHLNVNARCIGILYYFKISRYYNAMNAKLKWFLVFIPFIIIPEYSQLNMP